MDKYEMTKEDILADEKNYKKSVRILFIKEVLLVVIFSALAIAYASNL
jgi:hypothetical protein